MPKHDSALVQTFSLRLRALRVAGGLSQEDLATAAQIDRTYVSGCERGLRNPTLATLEKLADALSVPPHDLIRLPQ